MKHRPPYLVLVRPGDRRFTPPPADQWKHPILAKIEQLDTLDPAAVNVLEEVVDSFLADHKEDG